VQSGVHVNEKNTPLNVCWCGNKAVIIHFLNHELHLYSSYGDSKRIEREKSDQNKWCFLKQEVDGVRIITKSENKIFRQIPASYISVFDLESQEVGALLHRSYVGFEQGEPLEEDQFKKEKEKKKLVIGVEQCVKACRFELNFENAIRLLKGIKFDM
jgi:hypothetical protein